VRVCGEGDVGVRVAIPGRSGEVWLSGRQDRAGRPDDPGGSRSLDEGNSREEINRGRPPGGVCGFRSTAGESAGRPGGYTPTSKATGKCSNNVEAGMTNRPSRTSASSIAPLNTSQYRCGQAASGSSRCSITPLDCALPAPSSSVVSAQTVRPKGTVLPLGTSDAIR